MLTRDTQRQLLAIARAGLEARVRGTRVPESGSKGANQPGQGAFVTIFCNGELRGCLGRVTSDWPLPDLVREGVAMRKNQGLSWSQVAMAANAPMLIKAALVDGKPEVGVLPTGQVTGVIEELPTVAELLDRIAAEATATLARLHGP